MSHEFLAGPDEDGIDELELEIDSLEIWCDVANDPTYTRDPDWRRTAGQLAERALVLAKLVRELRTSRAVLLHEFQSACADHYAHHDHSDRPDRLHEVWDASYTPAFLDGEQSSV
jgi:hypothetical protein